jgi:hypothetical protein
MSEQVPAGAPPGPRPLAELAQEITSTAVRLAPATAVWLRLIGEFDARQGWGGYGIRRRLHHRPARPAGTRQRRHPGAAP